jgi:hypothetical protein
MRDYGVNYNSVPLKCDSFSVICLAQKLVFLWESETHKMRHHFLRNHVEKGDIEMRYIETEKQLTDIFTKLIDVTHFASLHAHAGGGGLVFAIPMAWFNGELVFYLYTLSYLHRIAFHSYLPNFLIASLIMLPCIWLTMLITVLA